VAGIFSLKRYMDERKINDSTYYIFRILYHFIVIFESDKGPGTYPLSPERARCYPLF
jgi:hypothetical protein